MSIFEKLFGNTQQLQQQPQQQVAVQQPQQIQPGNIPTDAAQTTASTSTAGTAVNGVVPASTDINGASKSTLDTFKDLYAPQDPKTIQQTAPLFNISQEGVLAAARKRDFSTAITPEQLTAITAGGATAQEAMLAIMNTMSQNVYAESALATTRLIEGALKEGGFTRQADVNSAIRTSSLQQTLGQDPIFSHPAAQPILASLQNQLMVKNPTATPAELATMAKEYVSAFAAMVQAPTNGPQKEKPINKTEDWSRFFDAV